MPPNSSPRAADGMDRDATFARMKRRALDLEAENRKLKAQVVAHTEAAARLSASVGRGGTDGAGTKPSRSLYDDLFEAKLANTRLRNKLSRSRGAHFAASETLEQVQMALHDPFATAFDRPDTESNFNPEGSVEGLFNASHSFSESTARPLATRKKTNIDFAALKRAMGRRLHGGDYMPANEALAIPEQASSEAYLNARIDRSAYKAELCGLRGGTLTYFKDLYGSVGKAVHALEYIFGDATKPDGLLACPQADFKKTCHAAMREVTHQLKALRRAVDSAATEFIERENVIKKAAVNSRVLRETQTDPIQIMDSQTEQRLQDLQQALEDWPQRYSILEQRCANLEKNMQTERTKAKAEMAKRDQHEASLKEMIQSLNESVYSLHDAAYKAIHNVYKHRHRWNSNCPNHFAAIPRAPAAATAKDGNVKPSHVLALTEAVRADVALLGNFAEYVVNDNIYGTDMSYRRPTSADAGFRDGFVAFQDGEGGSTPEPKPLTRSKSTAHITGLSKEPLPFARMEEWTKKQSELWSHRRATFVQPPPTNVKYDTTPTRQQVPFSSASETPNQQDRSASRRTSSAAPVQRLKPHFSLTPTDAPLPVPPSRDAAVSDKERAFRRRHSAVF
jgi:hypothetical protein